LDNGGGSTACGSVGCGTVFKLDQNGNETVLHRFSGTGEDDIFPKPPWSEMLRETFMAPP
jgi:uncharacterized repeat protein (TIGR03803 family)